MTPKLKRADDDGTGGGQPLTGAPTNTRRVRVRCPICAWEPDGGKYWQCERCFETFDTFTTRAHCPACDNSWAWTQCIKCGELSDHEAWYVADDSDPEAR